MGGEHGCLSLVNDTCCASSGLYDGLIPRPGESYRVYVCLYMCVCFIECGQSAEIEFYTYSEWVEIGQSNKGRRTVCFGKVLHRFGNLQSLDNN